MGATGADTKTAPVLPILIAMALAAVVGWLLRNYLGEDPAIGHFQRLDHMIGQHLRAVLAGVFGVRVGRQK